MHQLLTLPAGTAFTWVDILDPGEAEARTLSDEYGLPAEVVRDFLKQPHLPKVERFTEALLVIVRAWDERASGGETFQALTRRLVIFRTPEQVFTVRRREQPFVQTVLQKAHGPEAPPPRPEQLIRWLIGGAVHSYEDPLRSAEEALDRIESALLAKEVASDRLRPIYQVKRRCSVIKRVLARTLVILGELRADFHDEGGFLSDLHEEADRLQAWADELQEGATHLLNLHLSLQGHRTNEVMRVLTVFSAFFLPLTFIAGVYGMNFKHMPELDHPYGYYATWTAMAGLTLGIFMWFRNKGWMK